LRIQIIKAFDIELVNKILGSQNNYLLKNLHPFNMKN